MGGKTPTAQGWTPHLPGRSFPCVWPPFSLAVVVVEEMLRKLPQLEGGKAEWLQVWESLRSGRAFIGAV